MTFFWTSEGGNSFGEYFLNKPGNLFSNFDILLGTSQRTIVWKGHQDKPGYKRGKTNQQMECRIIIMIIASLHVNF
jgi:hypothetical protein